jgi:hypothetical protein
MENDIPALTLQEKTLIHLSEFKDMEDRFEHPEGVTQKGIAQTIGAQRKHMPRILKKLLDKEFIMEKRGRVSGSTQSMKVYLLTWNGISKANQIKKFVGDSKIKVRGKEGKIVEAKIEEINSLVNGSFSLLDIINNISDDGVFEGVMENLGDVEVPEAMPARHEIYWHTLLQVWKDGRASVDEEEILEELRKILSISNEEHIKMQEKIIKYASPVRKKLLDIYSVAYEQALDDEMITEDERRILEVLREKLGIGDEEREDIESKINDNHPKN